MNLINEKLYTNKKALIIFLLIILILIDIYISESITLINILYFINFDLNLYIFPYDLIRIPKILFILDFIFKIILFNSLIFLFYRYLLKLLGNYFRNDFTKITLVILMISTTLYLLNKHLVDYGHYYNKLKDLL